MRPRSAIWVERSLLIVGGVMAAYCLWVLVDAVGAQLALARRLEKVVPERSDARTATVAREEASSSGLVGRIEIPRLNWSALIIEGTGSTELRRGVGHVERTALPGEPGNVGLAGHRDSFFHCLRDIGEGDTIDVHTPDGDFRYRVDEIQIVDPDRGDLLDPTSSPTLTLVTCYPFGWIGPAPRRFVARASQVDLVRL